ncbi:MAG: hypothetical protein HYU71_02755 [Bacteroidetes bacterium]|nr:hypothetical protein [Bacteroidota bacterium]
MRSFLLPAVCCFLTLSGYAQTKTTTPVTRNQATVTPSGFEASLVQGTLTLNKSFKQIDGGKDFVPVYSLQKNDAGFNNRKPVQVSLSRQSFDSVFTKTTSDLASRWPLLNKYIEENHLTLTTENDWISIITWFNGLRQ